MNDKQLDQLQNLLGEFGLRCHYLIGFDEHGTFIESSFEPTELDAQALHAVFEEFLDQRKNDEQAVEFEWEEDDDEDAWEW